MTIYVVVPDYMYDGYGAPAAAFSSRELAEAWLSDKSGEWEVFPLEVEPTRIGE